MSITKIFEDLSSAKFKKFFVLERNIYKYRHKISKEDIDNFEMNNLVSLPTDFKEWWLIAGCGEIINNSLLIGEKDSMFKLDKAGVMTGYISLATDELRNYYVCDTQKSDKIYLCDGLGRGYCEIADSFYDFLTKLKNHNFDINNLIQNVQLKPV